MSVDIKTAVRAALDFIREMYEGDEDLTTLALEEVELADDRSHWLVMIGLGGETRASTMSVVAGNGLPRQYKRLEIDFETGTVLSMKASTR